MLAIIIAAVAAFGTLMAVVVAMYIDSRKKNRETTDRLIENAKMQTEMSRDIRENTEAVKNIVTLLEKQGGEIRDLREARIMADARMERIDGRSQAAFDRSDARKDEIKGIREDINKLRIAVQSLGVKA